MTINTPLEISVPGYGLPSNKMMLTIKTSSLDDEDEEVPRRRQAPFHNVAKSSTEQRLREVFEVLLLKELEEDDLFSLGSEDSFEYEDEDELTLGDECEFKIFDEDSVSLQKKRTNVPLLDRHPHSRRRRSNQPQDDDKSESPLLKEMTANDSGDFSRMNKRIQLRRNDLEQQEQEQPVVPVDDYDDENDDDDFWYQDIIIPIKDC